MRKRPAHRHDRGQAAIEYLGFLPLLLIVGLAGLQLGIVAYAAQQAGTAARAAARADTVDVPDDEVAPDPVAAGRAAVSGWIADRSEITVADGVATVRVSIPSVVPFWTFDDPIEKTATMPVPEEEDRP